LREDAQKLKEERTTLEGMIQSREASHQLSSPATDWWDAYVEAHKEPESINWPEFRATFCAHHVPQGVIKLKEFQDLK
jgi:hypothetical protein